MKVNIFTYLYLKRKYKLKKFMKYKNYPTKVNVENFISHIENSNNSPLIFQKIFEEYYEVKND